MLKSIFPLLVFAAVALGQDTRRACDGDWWNRQRKVMKLGYVYGMVESDRAIDTGGTIMQMADGLDVFYADFSNRAITVPRAAHIVAMSINGETPQKIERAISLARSLAANGL